MTCAMCAIWPTNSQFDQQIVTWLDADELPQLARYRSCTDFRGDDQDS